MGIILTGGFGLQIILSHVNTDFDALASMVAAKKVYPDAQLVISDRQDDRVSRFLNIYRDTFDFVRDIHVDWSKVETIILVDVASLNRVGRLPDDFNVENYKIIVYDHHPKHPNNVKYQEGIIDHVGAAVTLLIEKIREQNLAISEFEATLFGLGLYTDTGNFIYKNTTTRDLQTVSYLLEKGMNLSIVQRFSAQTLEPEQQDLLDNLLAESEMHEIDGLEIIVSSFEVKKFQGGLSLLTHKLLGIKGADVAITVVKMKNHVHIVGRATSNRVSLLPLLKKFGGGGHKQAGSAMVKNADRSVVLNDVMSQLPTMLEPAITARDIMSKPVKSLSPETTIEEAGQRMYRYGHSGYPIIKDGQLVGLITRRDLDKGNHHGLGHAPVKAYMTTNIITIHPETTLEEIQKLIIEHNIGRLPVIEDGKIIGIVTRTNIIEMLHNDFLTNTPIEKIDKTQKNLQNAMEQQLPKEVFTLLQQISQTANRMKKSVYLIGGIVRDIMLQKSNDDIDLVVEGNGILFARGLKEDYDGEIIEHDSFGTATWTHPSGIVIDITSSRLEYYDRPASLPDVEGSTLNEDLHRRDFTINAMALRLSGASFGELIDPFGGQEDLREKTIKVLHNLSFIEDPTRIFRGIRFEERFQFLMDEQTEKLALNSIDQVRELTPTRVVDQLKKLFSEGTPSNMIGRLFELNFWHQFNIETVHEIRSKEIAENLAMHYQAFDQECPSWFNFFLIPFYCQENLEMARTYALTKSDMKLLTEITHLQAFDEWHHQQNIGDYHAELKKYSSEAIIFVLASGLFEDKEQMIIYLERRSQLCNYFTGEDLMVLGMQPGPMFSKVLLQLEIEQLNGEIQSKEQAEQWITRFVSRQSL